MKSFEEELTKLNKAHPVRDWWNKNSYKVMRVLLFPLWLFVLARDKYREKRRNNMTYSNEEAKRLLDKYLPRCVKSWLNKDGSFLMFRYAGEYCGELDFYRFDWHMSKKDSTYYWKFYKKIQDYFLSTYQIEGYNKYCFTSESSEEERKLFLEKSECSPWENRDAVFFEKIASKS